ncbi:MAG: hypothetical protein IJW39_01140 [Opitutales bacterium]|nr:hypothetical protein [Opitutales bacterium]
MKKAIFCLVSLFLGLVAALADVPESTECVPEAPRQTAKKIVVVPVHGEINNANWYIFRRGVKKALADNADILILDVNTPGGELSLTLDYIDALQKFPGETLAFVNPDAISAGAYISGATQKIFFSPNGKIGAAAVVTGDGTDVDKTMKMKIDSYLAALTKTFSKENPYRADVLRAMFDADYVLKINGEILKDRNGDPVKPAGALLTLTAEEAMRPVGVPATPLFGAGIYNDLDTLIAEQFSGTPVSVEKIEPLGLERFAQLASPFLPILLGLGMLLIFIEIKSPGFGVPGISGIVLIGLYFAVQHAAGLAGYEGVLLFLAGIALILAEVFLMPGVFIFAIAGLACIIGSIFWSGIDFWKLPDGSYEFDWEMLSSPLEHLGLTVVTIFVATLLAWKLLPAKWFRDKIVLQNKVGEIEDSRVQGARSRNENLPATGAAGTALTDFRPLGIVEIDNRQFEASAESGASQRGDAIVVVGFRDFELIVRKN